ncbi:MAG TPA: hypothetical protein VL403_11995 [Candidatus Kryptonia bacterium]|nr:hypothetical protein [Candidatus Kryptonia bacterium]
MTKKKPDSPAKRNRAPGVAARPAKTRRKQIVDTAKAAAASAAPRRQRRAIFIDVENTSSEVDLLRVIEELQIDRATQPTEVTAAGNWKSVGQRLARRLAGLGAQLVHSAPAIGVRDWSDLWIAVAAGCWLGQAEPGDRLDILSDDRAFDAVGDAAAARGVLFHRISYHTLPMPSQAAAAKEPTQRRSRRGGRHRRRSNEHPLHPEAAPLTIASTSTHVQSLKSAVAHEEAHAASHEQIVGVVARLSGGSSQRWVNLDVLANALKAEGFTRPPGSPRLVTRVRKLKELEVSPNGMVRLLSAGRVPTAADAETAGSGTATAPVPPKRARRRGGRGRRRTDQAVATSTQEPSVDRESELTVES